MTTLSILFGLLVYVAICWLCWRAGLLVKTPQEDTDASDDARVDTIKAATLQSSDDTGAYIRRVQQDSRRVRAGAAK